MFSKPKRQNIEDTTYDTQISYKELRYGRYVFAAKLVAVAVVLVAGIFVLLTRIGKSMKTAVDRLPVAKYLALPESERTLYRVTVRNMLIDEVLQFREDTLLIELQDPKYVFLEDKGPYKSAEERNLYGCRLHAMELVLKRSLAELQYPFLYTRPVVSDSLKYFDLKKYRRLESAFPLYLTRKIDSVYRVPVVGDSGKTREVFLPDSIAGYFKTLFDVRDADRIFKKYMGEGPPAAAFPPSVEAFLKMTNEEKMAVRRFFVSLPENEQKKIRAVRVPVSSNFYCPPIDEAPSKFFHSLTQQKIHEVEIMNLLGLMYNLCTFSLMYPMAQVYYVNFDEGQNTNNTRLVALKAGRAPAHYTLDRKDCPRALMQGMYADITDYVVGWDQFKYFPKMPMKETSIRGRYFGIPRRGLDADAVLYRRDWLEEKGIIEWFKKKGWIHPKDKRPYIPFDWTYDDFRAIIKMMTDNDPTGRRKGFEERPGPLLYLEAHSFFHLMGGHFIKPDPTGKRTWSFWEDNPVFREGLKTVHDIYWIDKSVRSSVDINYGSLNQDFNGGRIGMVMNTPGSAVVSSLIQKYDYFGPDHPYGEVVGIAPIPGCGKFRNVDIADCSLLGFNPYLNPEQLQVSVEWIKAVYYGEFVANNVNYQVKESRMLGMESRVFRDALTTSYSMDYSQFDVDITSVFPALYVEYYDNLRSTQAFPAGPSAEDFGLLSPPTRMVQDRVFMMFAQVLINEDPDYNRIIQECAQHVNTASLNYRDEGAKGKMLKYLKAQQEYLKKNAPDYFKTVEERSKINIATVESWQE